METQKETVEILDLLTCPGFSVEKNVITAVNQAAAGLLISPGTDVRTLLLTGKEEYEAFSGTCLHLKLGCPEASATVVRKNGTDLFLLEETDDSALQAMSLAAMQLREPLSSAMSSIALLSQENSDALERLNRALYRMHRLVSNMSDAGSAPRTVLQQTRNLRSVFGEILEKARELTEKSGSTLNYTLPQEDIFGLADAEQLERAVLNILSNALKFSPKGSTIHAALTRSGKMLRLSISDSGSGISEKLLGSVFSRYLRQPGYEESRFGLGLGMVLVRNAALAHGGTVLIDQPDSQGTRVTMTMAIRQSSGTLRSPVFAVDYAGERDHALVELADVLPPELYQK